MELRELLLREDRLSKKEIIQIVVKLSVPAILAHLVLLLMEYIDAAMVGSLGADASASVGLVTTSVWLIGGLTEAVATGFSVQVAHHVGAGEFQQARRVFKQAIIVGVAASILVMGATVIISGPLPGILGGEGDVAANASVYMLVYAFTVPMQQLNYLSVNMLQCTGNMKVPSIMEMVMCVLNVGFNALFIFGLNLGVMGAALGTFAAYTVAGGFLFLYVCWKNPILRLRKTDSWGLESYVLKRAVRIGAPLGAQHTILCAAMVATVYIVAPLGSVGISANSFAITAEGLCYLPGYGFAAAATTLIGQSIGADRLDLAKRFALTSVLLCMATMTVAGVLMFVFCPYVLALLTPVKEIRTLAVQVLRIELFCEPIYAINLAGEGILRGAGDTLVPSIMNLVSIWGVRVTLAAWLVNVYGLKGVWIAMLVELCFRGLLFLVRLLRGKWLKKLK